MTNGPEKLRAIAHLPKFTHEDRVVENLANF